MSVALERAADADAGAELAEFEHSFEGLADQFELLAKVGEGTFSVVYKALDRTVRPPQVVAIKRIHATSSPTRIANELDILWELRRSDRIAGATDALRFQDQVLVVMPFIEYSDFRVVYAAGNLPEMRHYMRELVEALKYTARHQIIHRDVKPTNFLYNCQTRRGVLVDFGLAEWMPQADGRSSRSVCVCRSGESGSAAPQPLQGGYLKQDTRSARRANRAGTRGFRAPEVLLKCDNQSDKIDVWAAGIVLLTMLARRFPFFSSLDDCDALVEMASIFGRAEMRAVASIHGAAFETNIPTIGEARHPWHQVIDWCRDRPVAPFNERDVLERSAIDLLERMTELDPRRRISAAEAIHHPFLDVGPAPPPSAAPSASAVPQPSAMGVTAAAECRAATNNDAALSDHGVRGGPAQAPRNTGATFAGPGAAFAAPGAAFADPGAALNDHAGAAFADPGTGDHGALLADPETADTGAPGVAPANAGFPADIPTDSGNSTKSLVASQC